MEIKRKPNESIGALLRRFSRLGQQTNHVGTAKSKRYYKKKLTARQEKNRAIMGNHLGALRKRLERLGQYDNETFDAEKKKVKRALNI